MTTKTYDELLEELTLLKGQLEEKDRRLNTSESLARTLLWIAFVWNDHNCKKDPKEYAREHAAKLGINSFDLANEFIAREFAGSGRLLEMPKPTLFKETKEMIVSKVLLDTQIDLFVDVDPNLRWRHEQLSDTQVKNTKQTTFGLIAITQTKTEQDNFHYHCHLPDILGRVLPLYWLSDEQKIKFLLSMDFDAMFRRNETYIRDKIWKSFEISSSGQAV